MRAYVSISDIILLQVDPNSFEIAINVLKNFETKN